MWLKIFEQTHIETWHNMINKGIVDGSSATIEYQFDGQQEFQEIRCVNCYPEKFDLLMELIQSAWRRPAYAIAGRKSGVCNSRADEPYALAHRRVKP